jgi:DNA-binding MltR family transcriptional regulator
MRNELLDSFNLLLKNTSNESDRGLVLSMSAFMEDSLGLVLKKYLKSVATTNELIEGFNAPLGTFSARAKLAYSLGLISEKQYKDINLIRKIRNEFAHSWHITSLEDAKVSANVEALSESSINPGTHPLTNHLKFQYLASELLITLQFIQDSAQPSDALSKLKVI